MGAIRWVAKKRKGLKKRWRKLKKRVKNYLFDVAFPRIYKRACGAEVNSRKVLFVEESRSSLSNSFDEMYSAVIDQGKWDVRVVLLGQLSAGRLGYARNCARLARDAATARYIFIDEACRTLSAVELRPETTLVQLWHGCGAFKRFGMSTADLKFGGSRSAQISHPMYRNYSIVTVSSPQVIWAYKEAMCLDRRSSIVQATGVSRTDRLFRPEVVAGAKEHVAKLLAGAGERKLILYAPTFRGTVRKATAPDALDIPLMKAALGDKYALVIKHHPHITDPPRIPEGCEDFAFLVESGESLEDLMLASDACITDYSSMVFEYSLLSRPMVFFAYDLDDYCDWRGFYYDYGDFAPGPVCKTTQQVIDAFLAPNGGYEAEKVATFRQRFMSACDGRATQRIMRKIGMLEAAPGEARGEAQGATPAATPAATLGLGERPRISVIVPARNALPELHRTLKSLDDQTLSRGEYEVICVDDASSDGTGDALDAWAEGRGEGARVIHLSTPSGSPGRPRNIALDYARGEFVFCLDADDWLGPQALERMLSRVDEWGCDVLLVRQVGEMGKKVSNVLWEKNLQDAHPYRSRAMRSLASFKLVSLDLICAHGIRFFEDAKPEDEIYSVMACTFAERLSICGDYDYYHRCSRESAPGAEASNYDDTQANVLAYERLFEFVYEHATEEDVNATLMPHLVRHDLCEMLLAIAAMPDDAAERSLAQAVGLFASRTEAVMPRITLAVKVVVREGMTGNLDSLRGAIPLGKCLRERPELTKGHLSVQSMLLAIAQMPNDEAQRRLNEIREPLGTYAATSTSAQDPCDDGLLKAAVAGSLPSLRHAAERVVESTQAT